MENKFIIENDRVRVLGVLFKPNDKAVMHSHPNHVVYVLKSGKLKLTSSEKTSTESINIGFGNTESKLASLK